ncbi:MAG: response regulator transcription factor [Candidatus Tectomicrobia bacterium]
MMIRIFVVDDHAEVREGVKRITEDTEDLRVTGEASTGQEVVEQMVNQAWDVVLLDITMPGQSGLEVLHHLTQTYPSLPVLMFSVHSEPRYAAQAFKAGAAGYLTKDSSEELVGALRQVAQGGRYVSSALAEYLDL